MSVIVKSFDQSGEFDDSSAGDLVTRTVHDEARMTSPTAVRAALMVVAIWSVPAIGLAQVDLSGGWATRQHEDQPERGPGPHIGEFQGLPINDANRARGEAWSASLWTVPEHQCIPHPADYGPNFSNLKIWHDTDPVTGDIGWSDSASAGAGREASRAAT